MRARGDEGCKDRTDEDLRWLDFDPFGAEADRFAVCGGNRSAVRRTRRHGIWLNHGEFEKLVRYLEGVLLAKPASELTRDALRGAMDKIYQFSPLT